MERVWLDRRICSDSERMRLRFGFGLVDGVGSMVVLDHGSWWCVCCVDFFIEQMVYVKLGVYWPGEMWNR